MKWWIQKNNGWLLLLFILSLGITGSITPVINKVIYLVLLVGFLVFCFKDMKLRIQQDTYIKRYFQILTFFTLYGLLLTGVWSCLPNTYNFTPSYADIEELLFNYVLIPLFALVIGLYINQKTFERVMIVFSVCTVLNGLFLLYAYFDWRELIHNPVAFFEYVLSCRFTAGQSRYPWVEVFLKNYSFFPTIGAIIAMPFIGKYRGWKKTIPISLLILNIGLLLLTINRGVIIGLCVALIVTLFWLLRTFSWRKKILWSLGAIIVLSITIWAMPQDY